jgi:CheY-like chemotaxis protein/tRNA A-37 threonylcarbamoyl transferase component Bud32
MRVLAADDDEALARLLDRSLRSWGYEPVMVRDGAEAWKILKRAETPRVAILDWDMPGLPGIEVCRLLRSTPHGAEVYVLMLTGRSDKREIVEALEAGADDFLAKPFHPRELQLRLAKGVRDTQRSSIPHAASRPPESNVAAGTTLAGKFRLEREIARGGMGTVWLGVHLALGVNVAIKFMDPALAETSAYASFEREARAAARLRNEHTVRVYDHGIDSAGLPYLVMEYLGGESLRDRIVRLRVLPPAEVAEVVAHVAHALGEAHASGVVHRDVKPENVLLLEEHDRPHGFLAKLIDFGLANPTAQRGEGARGPTAGTPNYMSPEYLRGEIGPTPALDLWGLAVTAFVAMTGALPFEGDVLHDVYRRVCEEELPIPSRITAGVSLAFDAWFARACARDPAARFATAAELASALALACAGEGGAGAEGVPEGLPGMATEPDSERFPVEPVSRVGRR